MAYWTPCTLIKSDSDSGTRTHASVIVSMDSWIPVAPLPNIKNRPEALYSCVMVDLPLSVEFNHANLFFKLKRYGAKRY